MGEEASGGPVDDASVPPVDALDAPAVSRRLIRGGLGRTVAYVMGLVLGLAVVPLMIRQLGVDGYGYYVTAASLIVLIYGMTEAGLTTLGIREYATASETARTAFLRNLLGLRLTLTILGVAVAGVVLAVTGARAEVVHGTLILGLGLVLLSIQQSYAVVLSARLQLGRVAVLELARSICLYGAIVLVWIANGGLNAFYWSSVVAAAVAVGGTLVVLRKEIHIRPAYDLATWKRLIRETLPFGFSALVAVVYFRIGVVLMSYLSTPQETGYYAAAFRIVEVVAFAPWLLVSSAFPVMARAAERDSKRLEAALRRVFDISVLLGPWMAVSMIILAPVAVRVVAGDGFEPSVDVLRILAVAHATGFLAASGLYALLSLKRYRTLLRANFAAVAVAIVATSVLAPRYGATGAATATVGADFVLAAGCIIALVRHADLRPTARRLPAVALAVGTALAALLVPVHPVAQAIAATAGYFAVAYVLRAVPPEVTRAFLPLSPSRPRGA